MGDFQRKQEGLAGVFAPVAACHLHEAGRARVSSDCSDNNNSCRAITFILNQVVFWRLKKLSRRSQEDLKIVEEMNLCSYGAFQFKLCKRGQIPFCNQLSESTLDVNQIYL